MDSLQKTNIRTSRSKWGSFSSFSGCLGGSGTFCLALLYDLRGISVLINPSNFRFIADETTMRPAVPINLNLSLTLIALLEMENKNKKESIWCHSGYYHESLQPYANSKWEYSIPDQCLGDVYSLYLCFFSFSVCFIFQ